MFEIRIGCRLSFYQWGVKMDAMKFVEPERGEKEGIKEV